MPDCVSIEGVTFEFRENVEWPAVEANVQAALARGLPELRELPPTDIPVVICGGGPSLLDHIEELRARQRIGQHIVALNGVHDLLLHAGITPWAAMCCDSRPEDVRFFRKCSRTTDYYIASRCDPLVFSALRGRNVTLWHDVGVQSLVPGGLLIGGGSTIGVKALAVAFVLGYRRMHLYGFDSCYRDGAHHAYPQPMNDGEDVQTATVAGRSFRAAPWMIHQAQQFGQLSLMLAAEGCEIHVHGDGLLPCVARDMQRQMEAA